MYLKNLLLISLIAIAPNIYASDKSLQYEAPLLPVQGDINNLAPLVGKKSLFVKFWATWCKPCMEQMPHFEHVQKTMGDRINVVAINIDLNETAENIDNVIARYNLTMPVSRDATGKLARALGLKGTPYSVLINKAGEIVHTGHKADEAIDRKIAILAGSENDTLPAIYIKNSNHEVTVPKTGTAVLFFAATWCDWYLADTRPKLSKRCEAGQQWLANEHFSDDIVVRHIVNHLWTDDAAVRDYKTKYGFTSDIVIDDNGDSFLGFNIRQVPTLIVVKEGKITVHSSDPDEFPKIMSELSHSK